MTLDMERHVLVIFLDVLCFVIRLLMTSRPFFQSGAVSFLKSALSIFVMKPSRTSIRFSQITLLSGYMARIFRKMLHPEISVKNVFTWMGSTAMFMKFL